MRPELTPYADANLAYFISAPVDQRRPSRSAKRKGGAGHPRLQGAEERDCTAPVALAGTVSGAPKIRAMEIISEIEGEKRGPYGGAVGYFSYSGNMDTALVLRTGIYKDGVMYVQAGGGIVADSVAEDEYMETRHKSGAMMRAIELAEGRA